MSILCLTQALIFPKRTAEPLLFSQGTLNTHGCWSLHQSAIAWRYPSTNSWILKILACLMLVETGTSYGLNASFFTITCLFMVSPILRLITSLRSCRWSALFSSGLAATSSDISWMLVVSVWFFFLHQSCTCHSKQQMKQQNLGGWLIHISPVQRSVFGDVPSGNLT